MQKRNRGKRNSDLLGYSALNYSPRHPACTDYGIDPRAGMTSFSQRVDWKQAEVIRRRRDCAKLSLQAASSILPELQLWLYPDLLPVGELTIIAGSPRHGKTTLYCLLAAGVSRGTSYPIYEGLSPLGCGHVFIVSTEDSLPRTLVPRLVAAGADLDYIHFIGTNDNFGTVTPFSFADDSAVERLVAWGEHFDNNVGAIIIDPLYMAVDGDASNNAKAREAYERLTLLARRMTCAIVGIAHSIRNPFGVDSLSRVAGPPALRQVPREVLLVSKIRNGPTATGGTHVIVRAKNTLGNPDDGFEYCFKEVEIAGPNGPQMALKIVVTAALTGSANDILNEADRLEPAKAISKLEAAIKFLRDFLMAGSQLWIDIEKAAENVGVSKGTLMNAKTKLQIATNKRKGDGLSVWSLPFVKDDNAD